MRVPSRIALLITGLAPINAQHLINDLSFGYGQRINPDGGQNIPHFSILGKPNVPEVLSNKIILTPPAPGRQRAAVWSDGHVSQNSWIADIDFRVSGPERGGGNLVIWLVRDGEDAVGLNSVHTIGKFEGLALMIDQPTGTSGMLRGFLNDGNRDYSKQASVGLLAFGHCDFSYRNLGRPSQIKVRHSPSSFKVEIDGKLCFGSGNIHIPAGYRFGITAASAENPDSFEVFKLVVLREDGEAHAKTRHEEAHTVVGGEAGDAEKPLTTFGRSDTLTEDPYDNEIPDESAEKITSTAAQFADLHNRIQSVNHHIASVFQHVAMLNVAGEKRQEELSSMIGELKGLMTRLDRLDALDRKLDRIEDLERKLEAATQELRNMKADVAGKLRDSAQRIQYHVDDKHDALTKHFELHTGGHKKLILAIAGAQLLSVVAYLFYKRRKSMPKKYL